MNKYNSFEDASFEKNDTHEANQKVIELEKVLCDHCGRTASNAIRCLGMCVADNDY